MMKLGGFVVWENWMYRERSPDGGWSWGWWFGTRYLLLADYSNVKGRK